MARTILVLAAVLGVVGCRQARVSDEAGSRRDMIAGDALARSVDRAHAASPVVRSEATKGTPFPVAAPH